MGIYIDTKLRNYLKEDGTTVQHLFPEYWYHGSNKFFNKFDLRYMRKNYEQSQLGIYFSQYNTSKDGLAGSSAKEYAIDLSIREGGKPYVYKCKIDTKNALILDSSGWNSSVDYIDSQFILLKNTLDKYNYDTLIVYDFYCEEIKYGDYILVTTNIDNINIVDIIEY